MWGWGPLNLLPCTEAASVSRTASCLAVPAPVHSQLPVCDLVPKSCSIRASRQEVQLSNNLWHLYNTIHPSSDTAPSGGVQFPSLWIGPVRVTAKWHSETPQAGSFLLVVRPPSAAAVWHSLCAPRKTWTNGHLNTGTLRTNRSKRGRPGKARRPSPQARASAARPTAIRKPADTHAGSCFTAFSLRCSRKAGINYWTLPQEHPQPSVECWLGQFSSVPFGTSHGGSWQVGIRPSRTVFPSVSLSTSTFVPCTTKTTCARILISRVSFCRNQGWDTNEVTHTHTQGKMNICDYTKTEDP